MLEQIRRVAQHAAIHSDIHQELWHLQLESLLGEHRFDVDLAAQAIEFSSERGSVVAGAQLIASIAREPATLLWAWSPQFDYLTRGEGVAHRLREFGERAGLDEFAREEVPHGLEGPEQFERMRELAHDIGRAAIEVLGPGCRYYSMPTADEQTIAVLAVHGFSEPPPQATIEDVFVRLPRMLAQVDDIGWSLHGLVRLLPGWRWEQLEEDARQRAWRITGDDGRWFTFTAGYDEEGRLVSLGGRGIEEPEADGVGASAGGTGGAGQPGRA